MVTLQVWLSNIQYSIFETHAATHTFYTRENGSDFVPTKREYLNDSILSLTIVWMAASWKEQRRKLSPRRGEKARVMTSI